MKRTIDIILAGYLLQAMCYSLLLTFPIDGIFSQTKSNLPSSDSYKAVRQLFLNPPSELRSAPLWVWNDRVTKKQIDEQLTDFRAHGIGGVFIHPRPGLITEYLSNEWFALCRYTVEKGKKLGMNIWLYDENSYPSGFAGGHVPAQMPDAVRSGLGMSRVTELPKVFSSEPLFILQKTELGFVDITKDRKSKSFGLSEYYLFTVIRQKPNPWYGGFTYVDLMRREVTEKFLDVTLNAYKRVIGKEFGKVVPGVFQDEAEINPATEPNVPAVNYTPALFKVFQARWGYDLRLHLPSLYEDIGDWQRVRHNYYSTILDLFIDNWAKPYYDYCTKNNLAFTGHYWEHEWPRPVVSPDNLAMAAYAHMPGIDILMNDFQMDTHAQFGNARAVREIRSAANQLGMQRTMSETFGAGGWEMTFFDQKRIADWEYALGVNFMNQHLSYVTIKGARKTDHPLSFSYHEPWWKNYRILADYYGRLSVAHSLGAQLNRILVIEPTTTAWMHYAPKGDRAKIRTIEKLFQSFVNALEAAQLEYDLGSERTIREHGKVTSNQFIIGQRAYDLVILPPTLENLDQSTFSLLSQYLVAGGNVLCYGNPPSFLQGQRTDQIENVANRYSSSWTSSNDSVDIAVIERLCPSALSFVLSQSRDSNQQLLFHQRRKFKGFELLFLVNTSDKSAISGSITAPARSCEEWDGMTGAVKSYPYRFEKGKVNFEFSLPRGGSLLLCLRSTEVPPGVPGTKQRNALVSLTGPEVKRLGKNILALDYCDLTLGQNTERDLYFYDAQTKAYKFHGLPVNPWDHAVQYRKNIVEQDTFGVKTGFTSVYSFNVSDAVKKESFQAVIERPELFQVLINGVQIQPRKNEWWLDKAFGVFDIGRYVRNGENSIALRSSPFTIHTELQPIFILGDFALESQEKGFRIAASPAMKLGSWAEQGMPFYGDKIEYSKKYQLDRSQLTGHNIFISLGEWSGVVADVKINGKTIGSIAFEPFELNVARYLKSGVNEISVIVYGSLKNTLGPHHNNPLLGRAWPGAFQQGAKEGRPPGSKYHVVGYGLLEDFKLEVQIR
ncbi:MAG: glycosyl hydrolase [bacterium]